MRAYKPLGAQGPAVPTEDPPSGRPDSVPRVTCSRCDREWTLEYELDEMRAGNRAVEQFAMDHKRHTGHLPDDVSPWTARCRRCPDGETYLRERPAKRWAREHARHTRHEVAISHADLESPRTVSPDE